MKLDDLVFAVMPPMLAMLVEYFNPVNLESLSTRAEADLKPFNEYNAIKQLRTYTANFSAAAVEVSGLAPTIVSAFTAGFAILHEGSSQWPLIIYMMLLVATVLLLVWLVSSVSFIRLATMPVFAEPSDKFKKNLGHLQNITGVEFLSRIIYSVNGIIIFTATAAFFYSEERLGVQILNLISSFARRVGSLL